MRAWHLTAFDTPYVLSPGTTPLPPLAHPTDMLIRVRAASYCHTDAVVATGTVPPAPTLPHIGCHEFAGEVVIPPAGTADAHGTGDDGPLPSFKVGDRVAVAGRGNHVCGTCLECAADSAVLPDPPGYSVYCPAAGAGLGVDRPGGFAEYAVVDARQVGRVPTDLSMVEVAPLMCAGLTVFAALLKLDLARGQRLAILGCGGGLGHLALQFAAKMGLRVLGVDARDAALELARDLDSSGATEIIDARTRDAEAVRRDMGAADNRAHFSQMGVDAALVLADTQTAFDYGMALVRNGGKLMVLSFPAAGFHLNAFDLVIRRVSVEGSLIGSNAAMQRMFAFCVEQGVRARITRYPFEKLNELVADYHAGKPGKLVLEGSRAA